MSTKDILIAARTSLANPAKWIGGGEPYKFSRMCAGVAIDRAARDLVGHDHEKWSAACNVFRTTIGNPEIIKWNDAPGRTHAEVLAAFDAAIAASPVD